MSHSSHHVSHAMSDDKLIDLNAERAKRVHDLNDKRLNDVRQAFEQAMPLGKAKKKSKNKPKKRRNALNLLIQVSYLPSLRPVAGDIDPRQFLPPTSWLT